MSLISILRFLVVATIISILILFMLILPSGKRIELTQFANSKLLGYAQLESNLKNQTIKNWIKNYLPELWEKQIDTSNIFLKPIKKLFRTIQNFLITKISPYYFTALFYGIDEAENPLIVYIINSRIHRSIFKFIYLPLKLFPTSLVTKTCLLKDEIKINQKKHEVFKYDKYYFLLLQNLCVVSETRTALEYALSDTVETLPGNLSKIISFFNPGSDFKFIFDNRLKTGRLIQKYLEQKRAFFNTELAEDFYETILQRLKTYSDSIFGTVIQADIKDDDSIKGKWLVIMNNEKSARKITIVIDGLHQLISKELGDRELLYSVQRAIESNKIISEFEIKGLRKLIPPN